MQSADVEMIVEPGERMWTVGATVSAETARCACDWTVFDAVFPAPSVTVT